MHKKIKTDEFITCLKCGKLLQQITYKHLQKCSNITVQDYKEEFAGAKLRTSDHSDKIRLVNTFTKSGENNPMKNPVHYNKMIENQLKAVQCDEYRKKVSKRQKLNNNNPLLFGATGTSNLNYGRKHTMKSRLKMRKAILKDRELKKLDKFIPNYNLKACGVLNEIALLTNTHIQHGNNGGEFFINELVYWVDGYDVVNNIVYEYDEPHHFKNEKLKEKDIQRQHEIEEFLKCTFIRINKNTELSDIVDDLIEIKKLDGFSHIKY